MTYGLAVGPTVGWITWSTGTQLPGGHHTMIQRYRGMIQWSMWATNAPAASEKGWLLWVGWMANQR